MKIMTLHIGSVYGLFCRSLGAGYNFSYLPVFGAITPAGNVFLKLMGDGLVFELYTTRVWDLFCHYFVYLGCMCCVIQNPRAEIFLELQ
jgi:hypothetical protein